MRNLEWLRLPGDLSFLLAGILPVVYLVIRMFRERRRYAALPINAEAEEFVHAYDHD